MRLVRRLAWQLRLVAATKRFGAAEVIEEPR